MSYIRSLSNPESLYIWADKNGRVTISAGDPSSAGLLSMPRHVFETILARWEERYHPDEIKYKGARIREVWDPSGGGPRQEFTYAGWPAGTRVVMWDVTACYLARGCAERRRKKRGAR